MTCDVCGGDCQGQLCQFCGQEESRDGDWESRLTSTGDLPEEDDQAFLGADVHYCEPCDRVFGSLKALANHDCVSVIDGPDDPRLLTVDGGHALTEIGPRPSAQRAWDEARSGGDSR